MELLTFATRAWDCIKKKMRIWQLLNVNLHGSIEEETINILAIVLLLIVCLAFGKSLLPRNLTDIIVL